MKKKYMKRKVEDCEPGKEFIFRAPNGEELAKAKNIEEFVNIVKQIPLQSVLYHANEGHFGPWLEMVGEKMAAKEIKQIKGDTEEVREKIIKICTF